LETTEFFLMLEKNATSFRLLQKILAALFENKKPGSAL